MIPAVYFIQKWEKEIELQSQPGQRGRFLPAWVLSFLNDIKPVQAKQELSSRSADIKILKPTLLANDLRMEAKPALCCGDN